MAKGKTVAHTLAKQQKAISVAKFFEKNRHLLGFDNPKKALLTTIKEAVDNSLDAAEDARILPEISVEIIDMDDDRYRIIIEDNGPGIVKEQIPNVFAKLLYGSKFHRLKQGRGQQGIGISASVMYSQLTTGRPTKIISKIGPDHPAHCYELKVDTEKNKPEIISDEVVEWEKEHGIRIEMDIEGYYQKGRTSVDQYLKQTGIVNPHATIIYTNPRAEQYIFTRAAEKLPKEPEEIKPHPYGIELGTLMKMLDETKSRTVQSFFQNDFTRVGRGTAKKICENASVRPDATTSRLTREKAERLIKGIKETKIMSPPTDCISPIGAELLEKGLKKEIKAEFYTAVTRDAEVYRGFPFVIETAIAYGGDLPADKRARIMRFANRVPLQYQRSACASNKAASEVNWRNYGLSQSSGSLPQGPVVILVHIASVWVPFTSESKEAIAHYPEIIKEMKLALQECGRELGRYVRKKKRVKREMRKRNMIEQYIPHVAEALVELLEMTDTAKGRVEDNLKEVLKKKRGKIKKIEMENTEYDEKFAQIGKKDDE